MKNNINDQDLRMKKYKVTIEGKEKEIIANDLEMSNSQVSTGTNLIVFGSYINSIEMVQDGMNTGDFNVNLQNSLGETPLHFAANQKYIDITKLLLKNGAQYMADDDGEYPVLPTEFEELEMYFQDNIRSKNEIDILKKYDSIESIVSDFDNIYQDLFVYNNEDGYALEDLKEFTSVNKIIENLEKNIQWKQGVIQEEIDKL